MNDARHERGESLSWVERRRIAHIAAKRRAAWEEIRAMQQADVPVNPTTPAPTHTAGPGSYAGGPAPETRWTTGAPYEGFATATPQPLPAGQEARAAAPTGAVADWFLLLAHPMLAATALVLAVVGGTPLVDGRWQPVWLVGPLAVAAVLAGLYPRTWRNRNRGAARVTGVALSALLLVGAGVGALTQNVVEGRAQLRGSTLDRAVEMLREMERSRDVLADNQRLLGLPAEQAIPLVATYRAAAGQAIAIGQRWNPATAGVPPLEVFGEALVLLNLAGTQQAAALEAFLANLENPEPAIEAEALARAAEVGRILEELLPGVLTEVRTAIEAGAGGGAR